MLSLRVPKQHSQKVGYITPKQKHLLRMHAGKSSTPAICIHLLREAYKRPHFGIFESH